MHIRTAAPEDEPKIRALYQRVAAQGEGIARAEKEITEAYAQNFVERSIASGLILVAESPQDPDVLINEAVAFLDDDMAADGSSTASNPSLAPDTTYSDPMHSVLA